MSCNACAEAGGPVTHDYAPVGSFQETGDLSIYFAGGPEGSQAGIVVLPDIFGFDYKQVFQVCDRLAAAGFAVAAPDVFRGQPWPMAKSPADPANNFSQWLTTKANFGVLEPDVRAAAELLRGRGCARVGIVGFCWGASIAAQAAADGASFIACGGVHPTFFSREKEFAERLQGPVVILAAKGDPMEAVKEVTDGKPWGARCVFRRFDDQTHGFCAARGDWSKPEVAAAATEAIAMLASFFKANLLQATA